MNISQINRGATEYFAENFSVLVALASAGTVIAQYTVPGRCRFRLLEIGNYIGTVAAWGDITWHLLCNGIPVAPYNAILDQIGYAAQRSFSQKIEFSGGSLVQVTADNANAANVQVGVSLAWELIYDS